MAEELSDEQVFGTQPKGNELSDEDVFGASPTQEQPSGPFAFRQMSESEKLSAHVGRAGDIMAAFGHAFGEEYNEPLGLASGPVKEGLVKYGVLPGKASDYTDPRKPFMAFNEAVMLPLAAGLDAIWRTATSAGPRGLQAAGAEAGIPRDIVAMPEAFLGSPHPLGVPRLTPPLPSVKPEPIEPPRVKVEGVAQPIDTSVARSVAAKTGIPEVDAVLTSPTTQAVIDNAVVDRQYDVPYMAGGSVPMEDPTIYVDRHVPRQQTAPRASGPGTVTFNPADAWIVHENVEQHVMELLTKNGMSDGEAYRVAHFEYAEKAEQAWYRAHDIDQVAAEKEQMSWLPRIQHEKIAEAASQELPEGATNIPGGHRIPITNEEGKQVGRIDIELRSPTGRPEVIQVIGSQIDEGERGKGHGIDAYKKLADFALSQGKELWSDRTVEPEAQRIYEALRKRGYTVTEQDPNVVPYDAQYKVTAGPEGSIRTPPNLYEKPYPHENVAGAQHEAVTEAPPTPQEIARAREIIADNQEKIASPGQIVYHGSPYRFEKFDTSKIGTGEGAQSYGHGLYVAENPDVARDYIREPFSRQPAAGGNLYQAMLLQPKEAFLDYDRPLSEQPEMLAKMKAVGLAPPEADWSIGDYIFHHQTEMDEAELSRMLSEAGIPGIRYLDQGSRKGEPIEGGVAQWDPVDKVFRIRDSSGAVAGETRTLEHAKDIIAGRESPNPTSNYVVFNDKDLAITHINGEPLLQVAKDLGIIGEPRPNIAEGKPADAAAASMGGGAGKKPPPPPGGPPQPPQPPSPPPPEPGANPWRDRFEHFVGKLETPDDIKQLIRNAADEQGEFPAARQGDIKLNHVDDLAKAAGFHPGELNRRGLGRDLKNDKEVGIAMELMLQLADNMKTAAREVEADPSAENLIKLEEAIRRRDMGVEEVVGLRAEWGRTGNVFQQFMRDVKDQESLTKFLQDNAGGRTPKDLKDIAKKLGTLDRTKAAGFMNDMRNPSLWDKAFWVWMNWLISGLTTHAKYMGANLAFAGLEAGPTSLAAGAVGTVRRALGGGAEGAYIGETYRGLWGIVAGVPDAVRAAATAFRTGVQTPLPGEIAQNIVPKSAQIPFLQRQPIAGPVGTAISVPSRSAAAIHSLYNFIGYRVSMEKQAYRTAASEGLSSFDSAFWERRQNIADAPTKEMMNTGIEDAYRGTFINDLSPKLKRLTAAIKDIPVFRTLLPFMHIPFNIFARGAEYTPFVNLLVKDARDDLFGRNGAVKQDMAIGRLLVGSAVATTVANYYLNDKITGYGPTDPKERAQWTATGHIPYAVRIGDEWISYQRFGPVGTALGIMANMAEVMPHLQPDSEELATALAMTVHTTGRLMQDEVGMQGLAGFFDMIDDPEHKGARFASSMIGSAVVPYSSFMRQAASAMDPEMRVTKGLVDGLRYYIPGMRQQLLPKRDWLGAPFTNAGYGGDLPVPWISSIIQHRDATVSAIADEMQRLDLHPAPPQNKIGSIQLPPQMYDEYQALAGGLKRASLERWVNQPGWYNLPDFIRKTAFQNSIRTANETAGTYMKMQHPEIIVKNVENEVNRIQGVKPTKLKD